MSIRNLYNLAYSLLRWNYAQNDLNCDYPPKNWRKYRPVRDDTCLNDIPPRIVAAAMYAYEATLDDYVGIDRMARHPNTYGERYEEKKRKAAEKRQRAVWANAKHLKAWEWAEVEKKLKRLEELETNE